MDKQYDVIVIGLGREGAAVSGYFSNAGLSVLAVDEKPKQQLKHISPTVGENIRYVFNAQAVSFSCGENGIINGAAVCKEWDSFLVRGRLIVDCTEKKELRESTESLEIKSASGLYAVLRGIEPACRGIKFSFSSRLTPSVFFTENGLCCMASNGFSGEKRKETEAFLHGVAELMKAAEGGDLFWRSCSVYARSQSEMFCEAAKSLIRILETKKSDLKRLEGSIVFGQKDRDRIEKNIRGVLSKQEAAIATAKIVMNVLSGQLKLGELNAVLKTVAAINKLRRHYGKFPAEREGFADWKAECGLLWKNALAVTAPASPQKSSDDAQAFSEPEAIAGA